MPSPMSSILAGAVAALSAWAGSVSPKGTVGVAGDALEGYEQLRLNPTTWRAVMWWAGDSPMNPGRDDAVNARIAVGIAIAKGMALEATKELIQASATRPAVLDVIEGIISSVRGMHTATIAPPITHDSCYALRYTGGNWIKYEVPVAHFVFQADFTLSRQLPDRNPLKISLS